jgi:hypothetical protein
MIIMSAMKSQEYNLLLGKFIIIIKLIYVIFNNSALDQQLIIIIV